MEGDPLLSGSGIGGTYFNPLPPHGGRRHGDHTPGRTGRKFQSTPSAWRETFCSIMAFRTFFISIHSLRMEGDLSCLATSGSPPFISIHSLRMEGDLRVRRLIPECKDFNPLPPHGGRLLIHFSHLTFLSFQSTPSAWRETSFSDFNNFRFFISIHSLRMEGDLMSAQKL